MSKNIKTILLGQSGVGKTSIVHRFLNKTFTTNLDTTIGAAFNKINITDFYSEKRTTMIISNFQISFWFKLKT